MIGFLNRTAATPLISLKHRGLLFAWGIHFLSFPVTLSLRWNKGNKKSIIHFNDFPFYRKDVEDAAIDSFSGVASGL